MTTENSNLATPVESVGNAEDVQNVTIELNEAAEQVAEQNVEEQSVVEAADFAEEDAALDAEQAGLSLDDETAEEQEAEEGFHFSDLKVIFTNKGFWLIAILCVLFYSGVFPFLKFATKLMIYKYGVEPELAGLIPAMLPFGTILLTPIFGSLYDRLGKGATLMIIGSAMLTLVHVLFALPILNVWWFAILVMIVLGIAFSLVPSAMWPSVPKIIPMKQLGSAYAIIFYIQNIGLSMVPVMIGKVIQNYATIETAEGVTYVNLRTVWHCLYRCFVHPQACGQAQWLRSGAAKYAEVI